jgi:hypothetical protein
MDHCAFLRAFEKLRKETINFVTSVCLSVTLVTIKRLNVTFYVHCLSCYCAGNAPSGFITGDEFPD